MRAAPFYLIFAAIVISVNGEESTNYFGRRLEPVEVAADQETISYLLPRLASKYRPNGQWSGVTDPRFYVLTEMDSNAVDNQVNVGKYLRCGRKESRAVDKRGCISVMGVCGRVIWKLRRIALG